MARARNIKPGFFKNADLVELPMEARLLFIGLWTLADRAGRLEDRPKQIKMELFPADSVDVDACLDGLQKWGFVKRYVVGDRRLLQVVNFDKHQNPHRDEKVSALPAPDGSIDVAPDKHSASTVQAQCKEDAGTVAIGLIPDSLNLIPDSQTKTPIATPDGFAEFWAAYPKKVGKGAAEQSFKKARIGSQLIPVVLASVQRHIACEAWRKDGGQYIPNPATWLNQRRWEDEPLMDQSRKPLSPHHPPSASAFGGHVATDGAGRPIAVPEAMPEGVE